MEKGRLVTASSRGGDAYCVRHGPVLGVFRLSSSLGKREQFPSGNPNEIIGFLRSWSTSMASVRLRT